MTHQSTHGDVPTLPPPNLIEVFTEYAPAHPSLKVAIKEMRRLDVTEGHTGDCVRQPEVREFAISDYIDRVVDLVRAHWLETESELAPGGPKPLAGIYLALEKAGNIIAFGAFEHDTMVGYSVAILSSHLHYGYTYAQHDLLYVRPDHRRGSLALRLMRLTENVAKERGARWIAWHAKRGSTLESILSRTGYAPEEAIYKKEF